MQNEVFALMVAAVSSSVLTATVCKCHNASGARATPLTLGGLQEDDESLVKNGGCRESHFFF